jgi:putative NADH-flavin reductase
MNLLILGATGRTGRVLVEQALALGHTVTAFARNPAKVRTTHPNLRVAKGDISNYDSLEAAIRGQDAVLSALGTEVRVGALIGILLVCQVIARLAHLTGVVGLLVPIGVPILADLILFARTTELSEGTRKIVRAMEKLGVRRFVCESSLGVGDSKGQLGFLYSYVIIPVLLRSVFADKQVQETVIRESNLEWVIVRPAALTNGPRTGVYRSGFGTGDKSIRATISRADVAEFMLEQTTGDTFLGKTPGLSY